MREMVYKRLLLVCAGMFALAAATVALVVIPAVGSDESPNALPERAMAAFWVNAGLSILLAIACAGVAIPAQRKVPRTVAILVVVALSGLLLGLALIDAAVAFRSHQLIKQGTPAILFVCAAVDIVAGIVVVLVLARRPWKEWRA